MQTVRNERGAVPVLAILLIIAVVAVAGLAVYNANKASNKDTQAVETSPSSASSPEVSANPAVTPSPSPASDQELITAALKADLEKGGRPVAGTKITLYKLEGDYALTGIGAPQASGGMALLKKSQGAWSKVWSGQNGLQEKITELGFPPSFNNYGSAGSTVLFTY